jgi:Zn-dependent M28 family amino/carboxypeptidase
MGGRHEALLRAEGYVFRTLTEYGYAPERQPFEAAGKRVANIEAALPGKGEGIVVVGAHFDTVSFSPGADDNASAVAVMLELAGLAREGGPYEKTLRFVGFTNEEPPFFRTPDMGSRRYAAKCARDKDRLDAVLVLESVGYYDEAPGSQRYPAPLSSFYPDTGDFIAFVGNLGSIGLTKKVAGLFRENAEFPSRGGALPGRLTGVGWSDHWAFWREGYDAVMVTDTAMFRNPNYHRPADTADTLDYERTARVAAGLMRVIEELAQ